MWRHLPPLIAAMPPLLLPSVVHVGVGAGEHWSRRSSSSPAGQTRRRPRSAKAAARSPRSSLFTPSSPTLSAGSTPAPPALASPHGPTNLSSPSSPSSSAASSGGGTAAARSGEGAAPAAHRRAGEGRRRRLPGRGLCTPGTGEAPWRALFLVRLALLLFLTSASAP